ncbi:MAG: SH3 domain-containing protein [Clostridiales bacterium]|nr:SH3 domain-containing protein [Clostridiales bacterium]
MDNYENGPENMHRLRPPSNRRVRMPKRRKNNWTVLFITLFFLCLLALGVFAFVTYMPSFKTVDYHEYNGLDKGDIQLVLADEVLKLDNYPVIQNGEIYLPVDFVKEHVDKYIYWDTETSKLTITTEHMVMRMKTDELTAYVNEQPLSLNLAVYNIGKTAYMPKVLLEELYDIKINYGDEYNIVYVDYSGDDKESAKTQPKNTYLRVSPDKKSPYVEKLPEGTEVVTYKTIGESNGYIKVRTQKGIVGYVREKDLDGFTTIQGSVKEDIAPDYAEPVQIEGKINLAWDQIETPEANDGDSSRTSYEGLDVLSPTWFKFDRESYSGEMISIADLGYVNRAHENGYQVWPLISDEEDGEVCAQILSDQNKRENAVKQILAYVSMFGLDGINIDFERVREEDVEYFHQFLRELWPMLREQGVILSVDTFIPSAWSMYYNREEIAKTADYVCVMTYDENTYGGTSGPNASIGFVETGVVNMLNEVPKEKLIMGIPYYSRVWIEEEIDGEISYDIRSLGMDYAYRMFTENGAEFEWLPDMGCYYAEFDTVEDGRQLKYRTWLEDERSMALKLDLVEEYDVAGVAAWVLGLEKEEIWSLLEERLK